MNCQAVRNKILALPDPRHVPESLRDHVAGCEACREWARQAARLESLLGQIPVPPSNRKAELIAEFARGEPIITRPATAPTHEGTGTRVLTFLRRNVAVIGGLAAAVLVAVGGWRLLTSKDETRHEMAQATPENPFLKKVVRRNVEAAKANTPAKRLQALGGLADDLSAEARSLARVANPEELREVARWFDKVKGGLVTQATEKLPPNAMTPDERKRLIDSLARKLGDAASETEKLLGEVPPEAKPALQRIVESARDGQKKLQG